MTGEQKAWLDKNPGFEIVPSRIGGPVRYANVRWLFPDGRIEVRGPNAPPQQDPNAFQVGNKIINQGPAPGGEMTSLRSQGDINPDTFNPNK